MDLSLDSNVVIEILRGDAAGFRAKIEAALLAEVSVRLSAVVFHELAFGAYRSRRPELQMEKLNTVVASLEVDSWTTQDALAAAHLRSDLAARGTSIGVVDSLIAGHALSRGYALVTGNRREFARVPGLRVIDWTISDKPLENADPMTSLRRTPDEET